MRFIVLLSVIGLSLYSADDAVKPPAPPPDEIGVRAEPPRQKKAVDKEPVVRVTTLREKICEAGEFERLELLKKATDEQKTASPKTAQYLSRQIKDLKARKNSYLPTFRPKVPTVGVWPDGIIITQIVDKNAAIVEIDGEPFWMEFNTQGLADGEGFKTNKTILHVGTRRFKTVLGASRTIHHLKLLTDEELDAEAKE